MKSYTEEINKDGKHSGEQIFTSLVGDGVSGGTPIFVYVKNGRIVRIRPIVFKEEEAKPWTIKVGSETFTPAKKSNLAPFDVSIRREIYSHKRAKYPLKRVGFEPGGKSSTENRGEGKFVRISWDEALDIVTIELRRIKETYGNSAILTMASGHGQPGLVNGTHGLIRRVFDFWGGQTPMIRNPDSWEGWYWGAEHVWGFDKSNGIPDLFDTLEDTMQNSELLIFWSFDPEQSSWIHGQDYTVWFQWLKKLGKKMIFITPDLNWGASVHGDKWIPIRPGTDPALAAAIAYVWLKEDIYHKSYVRTHGYGFDEWKKYVLGEDDGVPKTPEWAQHITGVKSRIIEVLAREWASKTTMLMIRYGAACRVPYSTEWARMMVLLATMQGLGKPGVNISPMLAGAPCDPLYLTHPWKHKGTLIYPALSQVASKWPENLVKQEILQTLLPEAIFNPPVYWYAGRISEQLESQFNKRVYPMPFHSEIHMMWLDTVSMTTNWNNTNRWAEAYRSPKIECIIAQCVYLENDAQFADIILPACTHLEREDFCYPGYYTPGRGGAYNNLVCVYMKECVKPLYESKSDYEICRLVAKKLGVEKEFTEGNTVEDWIRKFYEISPLTQFISFEDFKEKGYYVYKFPDDWPRSPGLRWYHDKPAGSGLKTPSGKIEFYSQNLAKYFPDDEERPPVPRYIQYGETHQESLATPRSEEYPLLMESPHPRYRFHSDHENVPWLWEIPSHKIHKDGYYWEAMWMNPIDAEARCIKQGDVVRIFNERGSVLAAAYLTERIMPGVVRVPNGSRYEPIEVGRLTRNAVNTISPLKTTSKNAFGMVVTAYLVEVEKWEDGKGNQSS